MKFKLIVNTAVAAISVLAIAGIFKTAIAQPVSPGNLGIGNGGLPSNTNRIETPSNGGAIEPLGSQQFFRDGLSTLDTKPSPPPENPLTIKEENLVPTEIPSDSLMRDRDKPNDSKN
ncbi:MAG: hypothetical protein ACRC2R_23655 [Xenococcaceae cyanobacterium]